MQQFNIFQAIYLSFFSKKLYRDVAQNWGGKSFLYVFVLLILVCLYYGFALQQFSKLGYEEIYAKMAPQSPIVTIKEGKLSTPENRPYVIVDPESKNNLVVIDTSGHFKTVEEAKTPVLITETEVIMQHKTNETRIYSIPKNFDGVIDPKLVNEKVSQFLKIAWIPFFLFSLVVLYLYRILQALVYAIIGKFLL